LHSIECVVIGAGVIGLAIARGLALAGHSVLIVEREAHFGTITSARNSEVIHAGLYDLKDSLKARLCVQGRAQLYRYCHRYGIPHRRCGKLIVATTPGQHIELERISAAAADNGVEDVRWLSQKEAMALEPALRCRAALISPSTGIIDSHAYMLSLLGQAETAGVVLACRSAVTRLVPERNGILVCVGNDEMPMLNAHCVINSAGLNAPELAARTEGLAKAHRPRTWFAKGSYFTLAGRSPFSRLIYPTPEPGGLGVHLTLDMAGQARFGPDVEWISATDYQVDAARARDFYPAIRRYWPELKEDALRPGYCGVRPKLSGPGMPAVDFVVSGPSVHGVRGLINLFGIESPGLTSSLAIADLVKGLAREQVFS